MKPLFLTPAIAAPSGVTYQELIDDSLRLLAKAGILTMKEQGVAGQHMAVSANECLGMATRALAEAALQIQVFADEDEFKAAQS
jgi:hypothetical protein